MVGVVIPEVVAGGVWPEGPVSVEYGERFLGTGRGLRIE